jgi:iron(III) transport system substrate-binding protein
LICLAVPIIIASQNKTGEKTVVVYTSVDQVYAEPIFNNFEQKTGIRVLPVYDVESAKTTGLVNRLIAEKDNVQADVFWNNEFVQTVELKNQGVLASYKPLIAQDIQDSYIDPEGYWTATSGRARVIVVNTQLVNSGDYPKSIFDLLDTKWQGNQIAVANPLFGTTFTQAAAIYAVLGAERGRDYYEKLKARGIRVVDGNSVVMDMVAGGQASIGLTDTDDAGRAVEGNKPVKIIYPDQDQMGTLIIPGTVALLARAPHESEARLLIDYLAGAETEQELIYEGFCQIPIRPGQVTAKDPSASEVKGIKVSFTDVYRQMARVKTELEEIFMR